jgi:ribonuclease P protein component
LSTRRLGRGRTIRTRRTLELTLKSGEVVRTPYFRLRYLAGEGPPGVAFLAGREVGGAVKRNRAKRVLREAFRLSDENLGGIWTLVFVATNRAAAADSSDLRHAVTTALRRASDTAS